MQHTTIATDGQQAAFSDQPDFMFGVCEAIGEDLGFDPFYLRVALISLLFFSPVAMLASYAALGGAVALSRWLFPKPTAELAVTQAAPAAPAAADHPRHEQQRELVAA